MSGRSSTTVPERTTPSQLPGVYREDELDFALEDSGSTVLIADDQPLMRAALRMSLAAEPDIDVIGALGLMVVIAIVASHAG